MADRRHRRPLFPPWLLATCAATVALASAVAAAATLEDSFEGPEPSWEVAESDVGHRVVGHARSREAAHRGAACERFVLEASAGTTLRVQMPIEPARVIDEWKASLWVKADRPDIRLSARVVLPNFIAPKTGKPVEVLVPGSISKDAERWERLDVGRLATGLQRQLLALRAEHGPKGNLTNASVTHLVLELYSSPGRYDVAIDDVFVEGIVAAAPATATVTAPTNKTIRDADVQPAQFAAPPQQPFAPPPQMAPPQPQPPAAPQDPPSGLSRGVLEVGGMPFFPRAIDHNGEPLEWLAVVI
ncbi:MAG: hypothetical protein ACK48M_04310, partial [Planctomycetia bacterium]